MAPATWRSGENTTGRRERQCDAPGGTSLEVSRVRARVRRYVCGGRGKWRETKLQHQKAVVYYLF